jgi:hypothetical protein
MVLLFRVVSYRYWEGLQLLWGRVPSHYQKKIALEKKLNITPKLKMGFTRPGLPHPIKITLPPKKLF